MNNCVNAHRMLVMRRRTRKCLAILAEHDSPKLVCDIDGSIARVPANGLESRMSMEAEENIPSDVVEALDLPHGAGMGVRYWRDKYVSRLERGATAHENEER